MELWKCTRRYYNICEETGHNRYNNYRISMCLGRYMILEGILNRPSV